MNIEIFKNTVAHMINDYQMTTKGYWNKHKVQSVYLSELPTYRYDRFFLIEDNVYILPGNTVKEIYDVFDKKENIHNLSYNKSQNGNEYVNVPLNKFVPLDENILRFLKK